MIRLQKADLESGLKTSGKIINNKRIAFVDENYLGLVRDAGSLFVVAVGDGHTVVSKLVDGVDGETQELFLQFSRLDAPLSELEDELNLEFLEDQLKLVSGQVKLHFQGYQGNSMLEIVEQTGTLLDKVRSEGVEVGRKEFVEVLTYLHSLRDKDTTLNNLQDVYFTRDKAFVAGERFGVRMDYALPVEFGISVDASEILINFLGDKGEENFYFLIEEKEEGGQQITFVVGDSWYQVAEVTTQIFADVLNAFSSFTSEVTVPLSKYEFIKYVKLAKIFSLDDEDIIIKVDGGKGTVQSDTLGDEKNSSKGEFTVPEDVQDFEVAINGDDIKLIFDGLGANVDDEIQLQLNLDVDVEEAYFKHSKGDCLLSIRNLEV